MTNHERIEQLAEIVLNVASEVKDRGDLETVQREYWLQPFRYPTETARLKGLAERVRVRNPIMLDLDEVYRRLVLLTVKVIFENEGEDSARTRCMNTIATLVTFEGTQQLHLQLANLAVRRQFDFGGAEFHPIPNTGDTTEHQIKYDGPLGHGGPVDAVISYAVVPRAPGMDTKAWRNALDRVEEVLTMIRGIGLPTLWGREWRQAGVAGRGFDSGWVVFRRDHRKPWDMSMAASPLLAFMRLEDMLANYSPDEVKAVEQIYLSNSPTKIQRKVRQALAWLGEATLPASNASRFAKLSIAFETAVGGEASGDDQLKEIGVTESLAERVAFLLGGSAQTRSDWHRAVKRLYGSRSKVMHGELEPISDADLSRWAVLAWKSVRAMLRRTTEIQTVEEFVGWVRQQRYSLPDS